MSITTIQKEALRSFCTFATLVLIASVAYAGETPKAAVSIAIPDQKELEFLQFGTGEQLFGPYCNFELSYERTSNAPTNASVLCEVYSRDDRGQDKLELATYHYVKMPDAKGKSEVSIMPVGHPKVAPAVVRVSLIESTKPEVPRCVAMFAGAEVTTITAPLKAKELSNQLKMPARSKAE
jgi:hypothetical protein